MCQRRVVRVAAWPPSDGPLHDRHRPSEQLIALPLSQSVHGTKSTLQYPELPLPYHTCLLVRPRWKYSYPDSYSSLSNDQTDPALPSYREGDYGSSEEIMGELGLG